MFGPLASKTGFDTALTSLTEPTISFNRPNHSIDYKRKEKNMITKKDYIVLSL